MPLPKIVKDAAKLVSGNVWGQMIAFLAYLVLSRIYTPGDFAVYNIFFSYIEVLIILSTCKYEQAIVVADSDREAAALARLSLRLNTFVSLALITILLVLSLSPLSIQLSSYISLLIPVMVFFCGTTRVYMFLFSRARSFGAIALSEVVTSTAGVAFKIGLAFSSLLHGLGLPLGIVLGKIAGNINYWLRIRHLPVGALLMSNKSRKADCGQLPLRAEEIKAAARKHRNFPRYVMPKELLNSFSYNLPFLWLALYFDKPEVGLFSLALTFIFRPVNLINGVFEKLLYVRVAQKVHSRQPIGREIRNFVLLLNGVALPLFVGVFFFAEPLFTFVFSGRWSGIGYYVRCLIPWVFMVLSASSLSFLANVFSRQRTEFLFYVVLLLFRVAAVVYGIMAHDFRGSILLFSLSGAVVTAVLLCWYLMQVAHYEKGLHNESR